MLSKWNKQTRVLALVSIVLTGISVSPAAAQHDPTNALRVRLTGTCRNLPKTELIVILNHNELVPAHLTPSDPAHLTPSDPVHLTPSDPAHLTPSDRAHLEWEGSWHDPDYSSRQFFADSSTASARLRGARTDCRRSKSEKHNNRPEAVFSLDCDHNSTVDLTIGASSLSWSYTRFLQRPRRKELDCDCNDAAGPFSGVREIMDVRLPKQ